MFAYNNMKKQLELDLKEAMNDKPLGETSNCISHQEIARVLHADHSEYKMGTLVYGTYEEIEYWCEQNDMFVDKYLDHVNPSTLYNTAEWVGTGVSDPFSVSVPFDYRKNRAMGTFNTRGVNLDKW